MYLYSWKKYIQVYRMRTGYISVQCLTRLYLRYKLPFCFPLSDTPLPTKVKRKPYLELINGSVACVVSVQCC